MKQNIYDNQMFFDGYKKLRENMDSANMIEEKPSLLSMLPNLNGKRVLDLGCGYGENCKMFTNMGAMFVMGIDISTKMLAIANKENKCENVIFRNIAIEDINKLGERFHIVVSSLAVHYVMDFQSLIKDVFSLLENNGTFIFSQEHPLTTAPLTGAKWIKNTDGNIDHYCLRDYTLRGERNTTWIVEDVVKYHRTFSDIINTLTMSGFAIEKIDEPVASEEVVKRVPSYEKSKHKPNFLIIKSRKQVRLQKR